MAVNAHAAELEGVKLAPVQSHHPPAVDDRARNVKNTATKNPYQPITLAPLIHNALHSHQN
jgi:hypothetical protein